MYVCTYICILTLSSLVAVIGEQVSTPNAKVAPELTTTSSSKFKLMYFDARGAAEISRVLLKIGGIDYEDCRYSITPKSEGGFETVEYTEKKLAGVFAPNMDRVPLLSIDGEIVGQSRAIERYISVKCGMMGRTDEERAKIDCIVENVRDIKDKWGRIRMQGGFGTNPEKEKAIEKWFAGGDFSGWLSKLENSLPKNGAVSDVAVGVNISYADVSIWHLLRDYFYDHIDDVKAAEKTANCTKLTRIAQKVSKLPAVVSWLSQRPDTIF
mmetsp:Transcript_14246/g.23714  ORF Transcript_14246/g.23714 Transcript_14246/m.23714 type:complete len:268 (-) Transcript_14246:165-968(-)